MRLHFKFKGCAVFLRDSGFVQQSNPLDRKKRHKFLLSQNFRPFLRQVIWALFATRSCINICCKSLFLSEAQPGVLPPVSYQAMRHGCGVKRLGQ